MSPQQHPHQGGPVADAVMKAGDQHRAAPIVLDEVRIPERPCHVEWGAHQVTDESPQLGVTPWRRERDAVQVGIQIEQPVGNPARRTKR